ncbi:protein-lysine N-methyltransferase NDAI_0C04720 [Naumovozyma dairenensis CBS 421]|uniref:SET domain-containing protein n=1 Tax=Naumovozyma dairenensis (strain ATCC 10597 / BCRC 20456 / CBS 421 / NBRC 0211 / NRRL Y-12639) TaxID=1071378 RepID=G0W8M0_NAUDC|nr:hypothetical protein NDAI_0C04720 [Naumovozyma dairenensis CBS 421]CCD24131.1 hypothetical protein NDAI_0C04720 [Naumovozyma dairenensis CBS 421]
MDRKVDALISWLKESDGFYLNEKINVSEIENAGRGVVLVKDQLSKNERVVSIPPSHQLNFHTVIYHISKFNPSLDIPGVTYPHDEAVEINPENEDDPRYKIYGDFSKYYLLSLNSFQLLSLYVLIEKVLLPLWSDNQVESFWKPFFDVWPTKDELFTMPCIWVEDKSGQYKNTMIAHPPHSLKLMEKRRKVYHKDTVNLVPKIMEIKDKYFNDKPFPDSVLLNEEILNIYFNINSRCLYVNIPLKKFQNNDDHFTLAPFVDFLNHTPETDLHCYPARPKDLLGNKISNFTIMSGEYQYKKINEELFLNYGPHSNEFLLNEYGFVLPENKWNSVDLTAELEEQLISSGCKPFLRKHGYWGNYIMSLETIGFTTLVAFSFLVTKDVRRVERLIEGHISEDYFKPIIARKFKDFLSYLLQKNLKNSEKIKQQRERVTSEKEKICLDNVIQLYLDEYKIVSSHLEDFKRIIDEDDI